MRIGALIFPGIDQLDFTGPFEILSRLPWAEIHILWKSLEPVKDIHGLILTPTMTLAACPPLEVLVIPGGPGQESLMEDQEIIDFIRDCARQAQIVLSVCTGALLCGAAGLLVGQRATTHWAARNLLKLFGARPSRNRVVFSGNLITCAGVTSGLDGALVAVEMLAGKKTTQIIQLSIEYAPEPPFNCGDIRRASRSTAIATRKQLATLSAQRLKTSQRIGRLKGYWSGPVHD